MRVIFVFFAGLFIASCNYPSKLQEPIQAQYYQDFNCYGRNWPELPKCLSMRVLPGKQNGSCRQSVYFYKKALERFVGCKSGVLKRHITDLSYQVDEIIKCQDLARNPYERRSANSILCNMIPRPERGLENYPGSTILTQNFPKCLQFPSYQPKTFAQWQSCRPLAVKLLRHDIPEFQKVFDRTLREELLTLQDEVSQRLDCYEIGFLYC